MLTTKENNNKQEEEKMKVNIVLYNPHILIDGRPYCAEHIIADSWTRKDFNKDALTFVSTLAMSGHNFGVQLYVTSIEMEEA